MMLIYLYIRRLFLLMIVVVIAQLSTVSQTFAAEAAKLLFEKESPYQTIYVTQHDSQIKLGAGFKLSSSSAYDKNNPYQHVFEYTGLMVMGLSYLESPKNALVIGLGGGTLTKYLKKYYPDLAIDNVEMDPVVVNVARRYFDFSESSDNQVFVMDGRRYLQKNQRKYDLIFLDAYYGGYIPFHLLTREFLSLVKSRLTDKGVVVSNTWRSPSLYNRESATWAEVFGSFDSYLGSRSDNRVVIATNSAVRYSEPELIARMDKAQRQAGFEELDLASMAIKTLDRELAWPEDTPLLTDDFAPVNLLIDPRQGSIN